MLHRVTIRVPRSFLNFNMPGPEEMALEDLCKKLQEAIAAVDYRCEVIWDTYGGGTTSNLLMDVVVYDGNRQPHNAIWAKIKEIIEGGKFSVWADRLHGKFVQGTVLDPISGVLQPYTCMFG
jgi:hypothetical protein